MFEGASEPAEAPAGQPGGPDEAGYTTAKSPEFCIVHAPFSWIEAYLSSFQHSEVDSFRRVYRQRRRNGLESRGQGGVGVEAVR